MLTRMKIARGDKLHVVERPSKATDFADLAAAYGFGLAKDHAFVDGNKRVAFLAIGLFLAINGKRLRADQADAIRTILNLAASSLDEAGLASWIRANIA